MTAETAAAIPDAGSVGRGARIPRWVIPVVLLLAAGGTMGFLQLRKQLELSRLIAGLVDPDPDVRARGCYYLGKLDPSPRAVEALRALLAGENDPGVAESAGYALQRLRDEGALPLMSEAIDRVQPAPAMAKLISYYARLGGAESRSRIEEWAESGEIWWRMGGGLGLLELGEVGGAEILLEFAASREPEVRAFAADSLRRHSEPVTEMVGEYLDLGTAPGLGFSDAQLSALTEFWSGRDRTRELNDYLTWNREKNPSRRAVQRLLHAREKVERWVGLGE